MLFWMLNLALAQAPTELDQSILKWSSQAEGAAVNIKNSAQALATTAAQIQAEGRIGHLPVLRSQAEELARRAELFERIMAQ